MKAEYPKWKYHPEKEPVVVEGLHKEKELGPAWVESPAHFGVETCPGIKPDPHIAKRRKALGAK